MILLQKLKLSIEESHSANDGHAQGGGEKHFVEHLFLLVSALGLRQIVSTCSSYYKPEWSENRPARPAGLNPLHCSRFQRKSTSKPAGKSAGGKSIAAQSISAFYTPKSAGQGPRTQPLHVTPKKTSNTKSSQRKTAKFVPHPRADLIDMAFTKQTLQATPTSAMTLITHRIYTHKNLHHDRAHYSDALLNRLSNRRTCPEEQLRSPR